MQWFGEDEHGHIRVLGLPASTVWRGDTEALLDGFEPENPRVLIPRTYGLGWGLNLGALAVKAGWIRPDDSLPDLADHVPTPMRRAITLAPLLGGALTLGASVFVANQDAAAVKWSLTGKAVKFSSGPKAAAIPVMITGLVAALPHLVSRTTPLSQTAVDISNRADLLGAQSMAIATLIASYRSAKQPEQKQLLSAISPLLWPIVSTAVQVACVKAALSAIDDKLQARRDTKENNNE